MDLSLKIGKTEKKNKNKNEKQKPSTKTRIFTTEFRLLAAMSSEHTDMFTLTQTLIDG